MCLWAAFAPKAPKIMPMPLLKTKHHRGNMTLQQVPRPLQVQKVLESTRRVAIDVRVSSGNSAEQKGLSSGQNVVTGWPAWLTNVAPKVVGGWLPRRADSFEKLDKISQGNYSVVYKARDLETGKIVALKKVRFINMDPESVRFMAREIHILWRLDHPNVIKLEGIVTSRALQSLYLVFEYMEHDLSGLTAAPGLMLTEPQAGRHPQRRRLHARVGHRVCVGIWSFFSNWESEAF